MLRRNIIKLKQIENLDVFPKIDEEYKQATASGGTGTYCTLSFFLKFLLQMPGYFTHV